jgi:hypothetical protein
MTEALLSDVTAPRQPDWLTHFRLLDRPVRHVAENHHVAHAHGC